MQQLFAVGPEAPSSNAIGGLARVWLPPRCKLLRSELEVSRVFTSSLLSLLLLVTLVWGGCISCEQYSMWPGAASCCSPSGHCKTKTLPPPSSTRECQQIALDHHESLDFHTELPVVAVVKIEFPVHAIGALQRWHSVNLIEPSPPDLQILNSTFII